MKARHKATSKYLTDNDGDPEKVQFLPLFDRVFDVFQLEIQVDLHQILVFVVEFEMMYSIDPLFGRGV